MFPFSLALLHDVQVRSKEALTEADGFTADAL